MKKWLKVKVPCRETNIELKDGTLFTWRLKMSTISFSGFVACTNKQKALTYTKAISKPENQTDKTQTIRRKNNTEIRHE